MLGTRSHAQDVGQDSACELSSVLYSSKSATVPPARLACWVRLFWTSLDLYWGPQRKGNRPAFDPIRDLAVLQAKQNKKQKQRSPNENDSPDPPPGPLGEEGQEQN